MTKTKYCSWVQDGNILKLITDKGRWHFIMPEDWKISATHPDLFRLAEMVLLYPFLTKEIDNSEWKSSRKPGNYPGLSYSTGVDSNAAMILMPPDTRLVYYRRDYESRLRHDNADRCIAKTGSSVYQVESNSELIRCEYARLHHGFSTDYHCGVALILLADYLDIGSFATGMVLESAYLYSGYKYRNFANTIYWQKWNGIFSACGLPIYQPVAGCSEIITQRIVKEAGLAQYAVSCLMGEAGRICGQCYKCYRKLMGGKTIALPDSKVEAILNAIPLKMASSMIYTAQKALSNQVKPFSYIPQQLLPYMQHDVSWLEGYYPPYLDLIPAKYRELTKNNIEKYAKPMEIPYKMHEWNVENGA